MDENNFFEAPFLGDVETLRKGVTKEGISPNFAHKYGGHTLLQTACQNDKLEAIAVLLELGADPNKPFTRIDIGGRIIADHATALSSVKSKDAAQILVEAGADINWVDGFGFSPVVWAAMDRNLDLVEWLCENGAEYNKRLQVGGRQLTPAELIAEKIESYRRILGTKLSDKQVKFFEEYESVKKRLTN